MGGIGERSDAVKVRILRSALQDLREGSGFYEAAQNGLGAYFRASLRGDIKTLAVSGGVHEIRFDCHHAVARDFPYSIYYDVQGSYVLVVAVLDSRRSPDWIEQRLRERSRDH